MPGLAWIGGQSEFVAQGDTGNLVEKLQFCRQVRAVRGSSAFEKRPETAKLRLSGVFFLDFRDVASSIQAAASSVRP